MLERGDAVPHFEARTHRGEQFGYSTIWQHRNLILVTLPDAESDLSDNYTAALMAAAEEFNRDTTCVITRDSIPGMPTPGALVADRWGEIVYIAAASDVAGLPPPQDLRDWIGYVQTRCPECEGEAR